MSKIETMLVYERAVKTVSVADAGRVKLRSVPPCTRRGAELSVRLTVKSFEVSAVHVCKQVSSVCDVCADRKTSSFVCWTSFTTLCVLISLSTE